MALQYPLRRSSDCPHCREMNSRKVSSLGNHLPSRSQDCDALVSCQSPLQDPSSRICSSSGSPPPAASLGLPGACQGSILSPPSFSPRGTAPCRGLQLAGALRGPVKAAGTAPFLRRKINYWKISYCWNDILMLKIRKLSFISSV